MRSWTCSKFGALQRVRESSATTCVSMRRVTDLFPALVMVETSKIEPAPASQHVIAPNVSRCPVMWQCDLFIVLKAAQKERIWLQKVFFFLGGVPTKLRAAVTVVRVKENTLH